MRISLGLLDVHQEAFKLWCVSVGIDCRGRQHVSAVAFVVRTAVAYSAISPVNRDTDRVNRVVLSGEFQRLNSFGDHGASIVNAKFLAIFRSASGRGNFQPVATLNRKL